MKFRRFVLVPVVSSLVMVVIILAFSANGGTTAAQQPTPDSADATSPPPTELPPNADGQLAGGLSGAPLVPDDGPDAPNQPDVSLSYYLLIGTAFRPLTSDTTYASSFDGCVNWTGGTDARFQAPVLLPEGAEIKYIRFYYYDTSAAYDMLLRLSAYEPGVGSADLVFVQSYFSDGYGSTLSQLITHTVDMATNAYVLNFVAGTYDSSNQICGARIAYYAPPPELSVSSKTVNTTRVNAGDLMTYTVSVANSGGTAASFVLTDTLNPHLTLVSAPGLSGTTTLTATGIIGSQQLKLFHFTARVSSAYSGTVTNTAQLSGDGTTYALSAPPVIVSKRIYKVRLPLVRR